MQRQSPTAHGRPKACARIPTLGALGLIVSLYAVSAAQHAALPHVDEIPSAKSAFVDDPNFGKDPFFPKSGRRKVQIVVPVGVTPNANAFGQVFNSIVLKGISGLPGRRLALLNNRTLAVGEILEIKFNNQLVKVRCVEIRAKSVLLSAEGSTETKEIGFRSTL